MEWILSSQKFFPIFLNHQNDYFKLLVSHRKIFLNEISYTIQYVLFQSSNASEYEEYSLLQPRSPKTLRQWCSKGRKIHLKKKGN